MAATTAGAIKAYLESLGSGVPFFRDGPRPEQAPPYGVVQEAMPITWNATANGDFGDPAAPIYVTEVVTVDLIQRARTKATAVTARNAERYGLAESVARALHGCRLPAHPAPVTAVRVQDIDRIPISDNRVRHSITVRVERQLLAAEITP